MSDIIHVDFYAKDWLLGTQRLTLEERGAFIQITAAIYQYQGEIEYDAKWLSNLCNCSVRKIKSLIDSLLEKEFIHVNDGKISQEKAIKEIKKAQERREKASKNARKLSENSPKMSRKSPENEPISNKNNGVTSASHQSPVTNIKNNIKKDDEIDERPPDNPAGSFEDFWESYPRKTGKGAARTAWSNQIQFHGAKPEAMINAARNYRQRELDTEERYIKYPSKFLSEQMYLDHDLNVKPPEPVDLSKFEPWQRIVIEEFGLSVLNAWFAGTRLDGKTLKVPKKYNAERINQYYIHKLGGAINRVEVMGE